MTAPAKAIKESVYLSNTEKEIFCNIMKNSDDGKVSFLAGPSLASKNLLHSDAGYADHTDDVEEAAEDQDWVSEARTEQLNLNVEEIELSAKVVVENEESSDSEDYAWGDIYIVESLYLNLIELTFQDQNLYFIFRQLLWMYFRSKFHCPWLTWCP